MEPKALILDSDLVIIGLPLRTSPEKAAAEIAPHWQRFMGEGIAQKIATKDDDGRIYAVYCDYESDFRRPYTMVLGVRASPLAHVPDGLRRVRIPSGKYAAFSASGNPATVIWQTWSFVNTEWKGRDGRRYIADFERYAPDAQPGTVKAEVAIGIA